jgi:hypothetical protein
MIRHARSIGLDRFLVPYLRGASIPLPVAVPMSCGFAQPMSTECARVPMKCLKLMRTRNFLRLLLLGTALSWCADRAQADSICCDFGAARDCYAQVEPVGCDSGDRPTVIQPSGLTDTFQVTSSFTPSRTGDGGQGDDYSACGTTDIVAPPNTWVRFDIYPESSDIIPESDVIPDSIDTGSESGDVADSNGASFGGQVDAPRLQAIVHFQTTRGMGGAGGAAVNHATGAPCGLFSGPIAPQTELVDRLFLDNAEVPQGPFPRGLFRPPRAPNPGFVVLRRTTCRLIVIES